MARRLALISLGLLLALLLPPVAAALVDRLFPAPPEALTWLVEIPLATLILGYALIRAARPAKEPRPPAPADRQEQPDLRQ